MRSEEYHIQHLIKEKSLNAVAHPVMCTGETKIFIES